jgi:hypothetical protein
LLADQLLDDVARVQEGRKREVVVHAADDVREEAGDVGGNVPGLGQQIGVVDGVGADDAREQAVVEGLVEVRDGAAGAEGREMAQMTPSAPWSRRTSWP